jgi:spore coat polysaccharide biosynthesis predicted glycosyltransferase SpsG
LPYFTDVARDILKLIRAADISSKDIVIKNHPAAMVEKYKDILFSEWKIIDEDIYKLFSSAALVIGSASGTLIEAISCGIPVIAVKKDESFACDILPDYGKGLIWDEAINVDDLNYQIKSFKELLKNKPQEIKKIANDYKSMFFCEPTEDNIIRAFELNSDG